MLIQGTKNRLGTLLISLFIITINCGYYKPNWQYQKTRAAKYKSWDNQKYKHQEYKKKYDRKYYKWQGYSDEKYNTESWKNYKKNIQTKKVKKTNDKVQLKPTNTKKNQTKNLTPKKQIKKNENAKTIKVKSQEYKKIEHKKPANKPIQNTKKPSQEIINPNIVLKEQEQRNQMPIQVQQSLQPIMEVLQAINHNNQAFQSTIQKQKQLQKQIQKLKQEVVEHSPHEQKNDCSQRPIYDYNLLVLTWIPVNCYGDEQCQKDWLSQQDFKSPTIHGFRPYGSSSYYQSCFGLTGDPNCRINAYLMNFDIDEALWNVTGLLYQISQYWPALKFTHDEQAFYSQQWVMHGSCYLMNMIEDNPNAYKYDKASFNRTIMVEYFRNTITRFKKLSITVEPGKEYSQKQEFAGDIGFRGKETHFVLSCDENNEVNQIIFCFNRSKLPGKEVTIPCTLADTCDQTKNFRLKKPK